MSIPLNARYISVLYTLAFTYGSQVLENISASVMERYLNANLWAINRVTLEDDFMRFNLGFYQTIWQVNENLFMPAEL